MDKNCRHSYTYNNYNDKVLKICTLCGFTKKWTLLKLPPRYDRMEELRDAFCFKKFDPSKPKVCLPFNARQRRTALRSLLREYEAKLNSYDIEFNIIDVLSFRNYIDDIEFKVPSLPDSQRITLSFNECNRHFNKEYKFLRLSWMNRQANRLFAKIDLLLEAVSFTLIHKAPDGNHYDATFSLDGKEFKASFSEDKDRCLRVYDNVVSYSSRWYNDINQIFIRKLLDSSL